MASKTNASKLADLEFHFGSLGECMKILFIKDRSSINDFRERNRAITNPSFAVGRLELKTEKLAF